MLPARLIGYLAVLNMFVAISGFVHTENYWHILPMTIAMGFVIYCCIVSYKREQLEKIIIDRNSKFENHYCKVSTSNVVCFERENDLWVKEYGGPNGKPEGRTYMVFHCPWCGYQTETSKLRGKNG